MFGGVENAVGGMFGSPKKEPFGKASAMAMEEDSDDDDDGVAAAQEQQKKDAAEQEAKEAEAQAKKQEEEIRKRKEEEEREAERERIAAAARLAEEQEEIVQPDHVRRPRDGDTHGTKCGHGVRDGRDGVRGDVRGEERVRVGSHRHQKRRRFSHGQETRGFLRPAHGVRDGAGPDHGRQGEHQRRPQAQRGVHRVQL